MSRFSSDNASKRLEQLYRVLNSPLNIRTIKSSSVLSSKTILHLYNTPDDVYIVRPSQTQNIVLVYLARGLHVVTLCDRSILCAFVEPLLAWQDSDLGRPILASTVI